MTHNEEWVSVTRAYLTELYAEIAQLRRHVEGLQAANVELFDWLLNAAKREHRRVGRVD
jgi:hypothetical protein